MNFTEIENIIKNKLEDAQVEITDLTGTKDHLGIKVTSDHFKDKKLLEQHRMIMDILKEELKERIHAVKLKTLTFDK